MHNNTFRLQFVSISNSIIYIRVPLNINTTLVFFYSIYLFKIITRVFEPWGQLCQLYSSLFVPIHSRTFSSYNLRLKQLSLGVVCVCVCLIIFFGVGDMFHDIVVAIVIYF